MATQRLPLKVAWGKEQSRFARCNTAWPANSANQAARVSAPSSCVQTVLGPQSLQSAPYAHAGRRPACVPVPPSWHFPSVWHALLHRTEQCQPGGGMSDSPDKE
eukprot:2290536-Pleurochrysis_carterae.AAC.6